MRGLKPNQSDFFFLKRRKFWYQEMSVASRRLTCGGNDGALLVVLELPPLAVAVVVGCVFVFLCHHHHPFHCWPLNATLPSERILFFSHFTLSRKQHLIDHVQSLSRCYADLSNSFPVLILRRHGCLATQLASCPLLPPNQKCCNQ